MEYKGHACQNLKAELSRGPSPNQLAVCPEQTCENIEDRVTDANDGGQRAPVPFKHRSANAIRCFRGVIGLLDRERVGPEGTARLIVVGRQDLNLYFLVPENNNIRVSP